MAGLQRAGVFAAVQIQRFEGFDIDRAADGAFIQIGGGAFDHFHAGDQLGGQGVKTELAAKLPGGAHIFVHRHSAAIEAGHLEVGTQATHPHIHAFTTVAHHRHTGYALQSFRDILCGELTDIFRGDGIHHAHGVALGIQRRLQTSAVTTLHDHFFEQIGLSYIALGNSVLGKNRKAGQGNTADGSGQ